MEAEQQPEYDDSWIDKEDKLKLLRHIKDLYDVKFGWADDALMKSMIKYHYNMTVGKIDKKQYLLEKEDGETLQDFLDTLG